ncbi:MAG: hypothetical protein A2X23_07110 [Chloroflexi bacterium GWC2_73_18]|nr:MAG: hypothetical protein A2X23_07110 [Chloroflexi bacterium GWC2_73_18]
MADGPEAAERAGTSEPDVSPQGPPLASAFSLEDRPASGLYALAWLIAVLGAGLIGVAVAAAISENQGGSALLLAAGSGALFLAAALGAGYQAIARRTRRGPDAYRGPSPILLVAVVVSGALAIGFALSLAGVRLDASAGVLASALIVAGLYLGSVWLFVVREGALTWREMGWLAPGGSSGRLAVAFLYGVAIALPAILVGVFAGALLAALLGVEPPSPLPEPVDTQGMLVNVAVAVLVAPLGEELFFRGFAQTAWTRDLGWRAAIVRSAVLFALVHALTLTGNDFSEGLRIAVVAVAARLPVSLALGWVFARTGTIASPIGLHVTYNGVVLVLVEVARRASEGGFG